MKAADLFDFLVGDTPIWYCASMRWTSPYDSNKGFTLTELMVALAIVSILAVIGGVLFPHYLDKAKSVEAEMALAEIRRLQDDYHSRTGSYSSDLAQIGFRPSPPLRYHTVFVQVQKELQGWSYMVLLMPVDGDKPDRGGSYISKGADGTVVSNLPGQAGLKPGSACSVWNGWGSMEGGAIQGEERIEQSSSSSNGNPPCGQRRVVQHGKGGGLGAGM